MDHHATDSPPQPCEAAQRFCQYAYVAGPKKGTECGRFLRKAGTTVCGVHRRRAATVEARRAHALNRAERLMAGANARESDPRMQVEHVSLTDLGSAPIVLPPPLPQVVTRPLSPARFLGAPFEVLPRNRSILGDGIDEELRGLTTTQLLDTCRALESDTFREDYVVAQALQEELARLKAHLLRD